MIQDFKTREDYKKIAYFLLFFTLICLTYCSYVFYLNFYYTQSILNEVVKKIHFPYTTEKLIFLKFIPVMFLFTTYLMWYSTKPITQEKKTKYKNYGFIFFVSYLLFSVVEVFYFNNLITGFLSIIIFGCIFYFLLESQKTLVVDLKKDRRNVVESQFDQQRDFVLTEHSVNIKYVYSYLGDDYTSYANIVNPFRGSLVGGTPGSGKTFAVIEEYFRQFIMKGYSGAFYDYKFPTLGQNIYNYLNWYYDNEFIAGFDKEGEPIIKKSYPIKPKFYVINLDDPAYSHRCNPISEDSLESLADADDATKNLLLNINKTWIEKEGDFFTDSANVYTSMLMWYLKLMSNKYDYNVCSLPHLIALSTFPSTEIMFLILNNYNDLKPKMTPFLEALEKGALEQLAGQVASAGIALSKISSPELFYILTGNDFDFNINDPLNPKIVCVGNNPQRDDTYAAPLGLILAKIIKAINVQEFYDVDNQMIKRKNLPSFLIIDEFPTIYLRSIDKLIGTARSNMVAVVLGFQSFAQVVAGYTKDIADKIIRVCGNRLTGQLMDEDAEVMAKTLGKQKVLQKSFNYSHQDVSENQQVTMEEIVPASRISQLSQGEFVGVIADDFLYKEDNKIMFGAVIPPLDYKKKEKDLELPMIRDFSPADIDQQIVDFKKANKLLLNDIKLFLSNTPLNVLNTIVDKDNKTIIIKILDIFLKDEMYQSKVSKNELDLIEKINLLKEEIEKLQENKDAIDDEDIESLEEELEYEEKKLNKTKGNISFETYEAFKHFYVVLDLKNLINKILYLNKDDIRENNTLDIEKLDKFIDEAIKKGLILLNKNKIIKDYENSIYNDIYRIVGLEVVDLDIIDNFLKKNSSLKGIETLINIFTSILSNENFNDKHIKLEYQNFINNLEMRREILKDNSNQ